jgi:hypothetical protein
MALVSQLGTDCCDSSLVGATFAAVLEAGKHLDGI